MSIIGFDANKITSSRQSGYVDRMRIARNRPYQLTDCIVDGNTLDSFGSLDAEIKSRRVRIEGESLAFHPIGPKCGNSRGNSVGGCV